MAKELFGTDGIRGVPGTPPLDDRTLYSTGRALGEYLKREHGAAHVLIGMDTRESRRFWLRDWPPRARAPNSRE